MEQTIILNLCFIAKCKCDDSNDSFEINWIIRYDIILVVFFFCGVWSLAYKSRNVNVGIFKFLVIFVFKRGRRSTSLF